MHQWHQWQQKTIEFFDFIVPADGFTTPIIIIKIIMSLVMERKLKGYQI